MATKLIGIRTGRIEETFKQEDDAPDGEIPFAGVVEACEEWAEQGFRIMRVHIVENTGVALVVLDDSGRNPYN